MIHTKLYNHIQYYIINYKNIIRLFLLYLEWNLTLKINTKIEFCLPYLEWTITYPKPSNFFRISFGFLNNSLLVEMCVEKFCLISVNRMVIFDMFDV